jgi:hypothetical protein
MAFNPSLPVNGSQIVAGELRGQLNALKALIDAQAAQIADLQNQINDRALKPAAMGYLNISFSSAPSVQNLMEMEGFINDLVQALQS